MTEELVLHPDTDGKTHYNIYTKARTRLGRIATNLNDSPLVHPLYGPFRCLESLWYYLRSGKVDERLRVMSGYEVKNVGKTLPKVFNNNFQREFKLGILCKVRDNQELMDLLKASDPALPFVHYYYYGKDSNNLVIRRPNGHEWQMEFWEEIRRELIAKGQVDDMYNDLLSTFHQ